jgi:hypothetical protein
MKLKQEKTEIQSVDSLTLECYGLAEAHVNRIMKNALEQGVESFSVCESFGFAVGLDLRSVKAKLRSFGGILHAIEESEALLEHMGCFAVLRFAQKPKYCAARVKLWAPNEEIGKQFEAAVKGAFESNMIEGTMFGVHWAYMGTRGLDDVYIEEMFEDDLIDEAYPALDEYGGVEKFIESFLGSDEAVLILQGTPGAGKTRLVRKILAEISRLSHEAGGDDFGSKTTALYTGDAKVMESDEIFARFITGEERAFVVEDADHMLRPRADGNDNLHRFLAIADGIVRAGGRKIVFSTNLPNISDVDDALVRRGRCFARIHFQSLTLEQAKRLGERLAPGLGSRIPELAEQCTKGEDRALSVAKVYAWAGRSKDI